MALCSSCNFNEAKIGDVCRGCWRSGKGYHPERSTAAAPVVTQQPKATWKKHSPRAHTPTRAEKKEAEVKAQHPSRAMGVVTPISNADHKDKPATRWHVDEPTTTTTVAGGPAIQMTIDTSVLTNPDPDFLKNLLAERARLRERGTLAKPTSSGCWLCLDTEDYGPPCGVCRSLLDDFRAWLESAVS